MHKVPDIETFNGFDSHLMPLQMHSRLANKQITQVLNCDNSWSKMPLFTNIINRTNIKQFQVLDI